MSQTGADVGSEAIVLSAESVPTGRGPSSVGVGSDVVLLTDSIAQGEGGAVELSDLTGDTALYVGDTVTLTVAAVNTGTVDSDFTVEFTENGGVIDTTTQTLGGEEEIEYFTTVTKSQTGKWTYQANASNELEVAWFDFRPSNLLAFPTTVWLGASDTTSELSIRVEVPPSEASDKTVKIEFLDGLAEIAEETQTISPGNTYTYTKTVDSSEEVTRAYQARITDTDSGLSVLSNSVDVTWTNDEEGAIELSPLSANTLLLYKGDTVTLSVDAVNTTDTPVAYGLRFYQSVTEIGGTEKTIAPRQQKTYTQTDSRSEVGTYTYVAQDTAGVNRTNELDVTYMNVRPGDLTASLTTLYLSDDVTTTTLSLPVENPSNTDSVDVQVQLLENGSPVAATTKTIGTTNIATYRFDRQKSEIGEYNYRARVTEVNNDLSGLSNPVRVRWLEENKDHGQVPIGGSISGVDEEPASGSWSAYDGSTKRIAINDTTDTWVENVSNDDPKFNDPNNSDFDDAIIRWYQEDWVGTGVMEIRLYVSNGGDTDEEITFTIGDYSASYSYINDPRELVETSIFWADGLVTDTNGNVRGLWK